MVVQGGNVREEEGEGMDVQGMLGDDEEGEGARVGRKRKSVCQACVSCNGTYDPCKKANNTNKAEGSK